MTDYDKDQARMRIRDEMEKLRGEAPLVESLAIVASVLIDKLVDLEEAVHKLKARGW